MMTEDCKKAYLEGVNKGYADAKAGATLEQSIKLRQVPLMLDGHATPSLR